MLKHNRSVGRRSTSRMSNMFSMSDGGDALLFSTWQRAQAKPPHAADRPLSGRPALFLDQRQRSEPREPEDHFDAVSKHHSSWQARPEGRCHEFSGFRFLWICRVVARGQGWIVHGITDEV